MGISQLKDEYPFLGELLKWYDTLDQSVDENDPNEEILMLCDEDGKFKSNLTKDQKSTCKKLLRNLLLCNGLDMNNHTNFCSNLYVWLYFEIKKSRISNDIVKEIFELPMSRENEGHNYCVYDSFNDEINNPENLIKLGIFNYNVDTFQSMLKHSEKSKDCYLKKYVYECVDIYYKIKNAYNFPFPCNSIQQKNACDIINVFNMLYTSKISKGKGIIHTFPELSPDAPLNYTDVCPVEETESTPITGVTQQDTSTTRGASTALTAMVGIPPFLALIYKFTPVGKFFRFGNKNNTIITSNFDKNMENELFHAINKDSNIKDIPPKYNIGYEPI